MPFILADQLKYVTEARRSKFRPSKFRRFLPVDSAPPAWAELVEYSEILEYGEDPQLVGNESVTNLPQPTISKSASTIRIRRFGMSYSWTGNEMQRAEAEGLQLSPAKALVNQRKAETFLDKIAAGVYLSALGLPGLLNIAGKTANTASAKTGGGTAWTGATFDEIVADIAQGLQAVYSDTLENYEANLCILPVARYQLLERSVHPVSSESCLSLVRRMFPGVAFEAWNRTALADQAGTGPRMVTMHAASEVARIIIPQELTDVSTRQGPLAATIVDQQMATAGVLVEDSTAIVYTDGV